MSQRGHQAKRLVYVPVSLWELKNNELLILPKDKQNHLAKVLRLSEGDSVLVTDGVGSLYEGQLTLAEVPTGDGVLKKTLAVRNLNKCQNASSVGHCIDRAYTLFIGMSKNNIMDQIIDQCTQLGVRTIVPVVTSRSVVIPKKNELMKYVYRWRTIAGEALEQSQGIWMPNIAEPISFNEWGACAPKIQWKYVLCSESRGNTSMAFSSEQWGAADDVGLFIGPEGGLSEKEVDALQKLDFNKSSLGTRILRVETAVVAAISAMRQEDQLKWKTRK